MRLREEIICKHFLSSYVRFILREGVGVNIISRDKPWDFEISLSNNDHFYIEVTSIADNQVLFKNNKREEELQKLCIKSQFVSKC